MTSETRAKREGGEKKRDQVENDDKVNFVSQLSEFLFEILQL